MQNWLPKGLPTGSVAPHRSAAKAALCENAPAQEAACRAEHPGLAAMPPSLSLALHASFVQGSLLLLLLLSAVCKTASGVLGDWASAACSAALGVCTKREWRVGAHTMGLGPSMEAV